MKNITLGNDGKYRWVYELNLYKNFVVLLEILKIFGHIDAGLVVFTIITDLLSGQSVAEVFSDVWTLYLILTGILLVLCLIGYFVYAIIMGGKYIVSFEMDEEKIVHMQMEKQYDKATILGEITALTGAFTNNPTVAGVGLLSMSKQSSTSEFSKVKKITPLRKFNTIKLDAPLNHNQIYVEDEDFDFVYDFIKKQVGNNK